MKGDQKKKTIAQFQKHQKDTGSSLVQVAVLSERIKHLTEHLKTHPKDDHSRRGLFQLVGKRRKHLNYLKQKDPAGFKKVTEDLGIRTGATA